MPPTLESFVKRLSDSGLMTPDEAGRLCDTAGVEDAKTFAEGLVRQKKLTKYQAQILWNKSGEPLVIGSYTILSKLGEGGMGQVYLAQHRTMKRLVALKILPSSLDNMIKRFQREVEVSAQLSHPNVVRAYDAGEDNGIHFLTMEYVEGHDLGRIVKRS